MCSPLHYSYLSTGHEPPVDPVAGPAADPPDGGLALDGALAPNRALAPDGPDHASGAPPAGRAPDELRRPAAEGRTTPAGAGGHP